MARLRHSFAGDARRFPRRKSINGVYRSRHAMIQRTQHLAALPSASGKKQ